MKYKNRRDDKYNRYEPNSYYIGIVEAMAYVFEYAVKKYHYNLLDFTQKFLQSDVFDRFHEDISLFSQSPLYVVEHFLREEKVNVKLNEESPGKLSLKDSANAGHWLGYVLCTWHIVDEITGKEILEKYDVEMIILDYFPLHCTSVSLAIDEIKREYTREKIQEDAKKSGRDIEIVKEELY